MLRIANVSTAQSMPSLGYGSVSYPKVQEVQISFTCTVQHLSQLVWRNELFHQPETSKPLLWARVLMFTNATKHRYLPQ